MTSEMRVRLLVLLGVIGVVLAASWGRSGQETTEAVSDSAATDQSAVGSSFDYVQPIPQSLALDAGKVALGRKLFFDAILSADNTIACSSCHSLSKGGADSRVHSIGINGAEGSINTPTVFNSGFNFVQFWDGRAATLEDQVDGPLNHPKEMGSNWKQVTDKLRANVDYRADFARLYHNKLTPENVKDAIATFERSLITPNAPFDKFLRGNSAAITARARHGYELFKSYGCISCHQGVNLGGNMYQKMGIMGDYFQARGHLAESDLGRYNVTHQEDDRYAFKVPGLRNVALTPPYFHDGSASTLPDAVRVMAQYQLGRSVPEADMSDMVEFLYSLTGESPKAAHD
ncbi:MAG: c-type cytochrome [Nitrosomonadales bacterium]|nr:c-type cytochrome [Nitrosomonadales bacterium]